jgi:hypothetical protein
VCSSTCYDDDHVFNVFTLLHQNNARRAWDDTVYMIKMGSRMGYKVDELKAESSENIESKEKAFL